MPSAVAHAGRAKVLSKKTKKWPGRLSSRPIKILMVDTLSRGVAASAEAAVTPCRAARSGAATTATAATATAASTTTAPATSAATTTTAPGHLLHRAARLLVEQVEGGEAHVGDFFLTQRDRLRRDEAPLLRRICGRIGCCGGASRQAKSQTRSAQHRHGGFNNSLPLRSLFHSSHRRILHELFRTDSNPFRLHPAAATIASTMARCKVSGFTNSLWCIQFPFILMNDTGVSFPIRIGTKLSSQFAKAMA